MAAVLGGSPGAVLSHRTASRLWSIGTEEGDEIEISVPIARRPRMAGVVVHRRARLGTRDTTTYQRLPVTSPTRTLIDLATFLTRNALEEAVIEADKRDLIRADALRHALGSHAGEPGTGVLRELLDRRSFVLTDSQLERRFLRIVEQAGLPTPMTQHHLDGFRVDFFWPELKLVVETDGLRYHRTAAQQTADRRRDQAHVAAGRTALRFSHAQVAFEPQEVQITLRRVAERVSRPAAGRLSSS
jgi:very-short-patch-repair endonuclease